MGEGGAEWSEAIWHDGGAADAARPDRTRPAAPKPVGVVAVAEAHHDEPSVPQRTSPLPPEKSSGGRWALESENGVMSAVVERWMIPYS